MNNIVTSVRVRPFSKKEIKDKALNVIRMNNNETVIEYKDKKHSFLFDHSFWSYDGGETNAAGYTEATNEKYTDQKKLFEKLGKPLIDNSWKGYNCSLFAYGQTGSGKTYSVMGYKENKGLVPMICENLFEGINKAASSLKEGEKYQVSMGMLEIYNEKLRDLLNPGKSENLVLKESPERGFHAPNQLMVHVDSYASVLQKIQSGNKLRTIASTNMNETSSRAHTVVSLQFLQILHDEKNRLTTKTSFINLVDLAGSEQVKKSQAEGARMVEAQNINRSLHVLGLCLNNLSTKQSHVPYRDSVLTKLLMNALGGNSKTILLAALSPSESNFDESLSTLRFAERAKKVVTNAKVNVSETDKVIKNLKEENLQLQQLIKDLQEKKSTKETSKDDLRRLEELQEQMMRNKEEMNAMTLSWKEQLQQAQDELEKQKKVDEERKLKLKETPHMYNLNEDPALNKVIVYMFDKPVTVIGNSKAQQNFSATDTIDIDLQGINIMGKHAEIRQDKDSKKTFISPIGNANLLINGTKVTKEQELKHFDRILLGNSFYFFHFDPLVMDDGSNIKEPSIEEARQEVTEKSEEFKGLQDKRLLEELSSIYPLVAEANIMAKEMNKKVIYSLLIFKENLPGYNDSPESQVRVRVFLTNKKFEYFMETNEFKDVRYGMVDMYHDFRDGNLKIQEGTIDPFIPGESDICCMGFSYIFLQSLKHALDFSDQYPIFNYQGKEVGTLKFSCTPCDSFWNASIISDKGILVGSKLFIKMTIEQIQLTQTLFKKVYYRYKFFDQTIKSPMSKVIKDEAKFDFESKIDGMTVNNDVLKYLEDMMGVEVWGCYGDSEASNDVIKFTEKKSEHDSAVEKFLEEFQNLALQRQKDGHTNIEMADIAKIVPKDFVSSSGRRGSMSCVVQ